MNYIFRTDRYATGPRGVGRARMDADYEVAGSKTSSAA
jgi:hypothetical protein